MFRNGHWSVWTIGGFARIEEWLIQMCECLTEKTSTPTAGSHAPAESASSETAIVQHVYRDSFDLITANSRWNNLSLAESGAQQLIKANARRTFTEMQQLMQGTSDFNAAMARWEILTFEFRKSLVPAKQRHDDPASIRSVLSCLTSTCFFNVNHLPKATLHLLDKKFARPQDPETIRDSIVEHCRLAPEGLSRPIYYPPAGLCNPTKCLLKGTEITLRKAGTVGTYIVVSNQGVAFHANAERVFKARDGGDSVTLEYQPQYVVDHLKRGIILSAGSVGRGESGLTVSSLTVKVTDTIVTFRSLAGPIPHDFFFGAGELAHGP